jgi:hypothetical protein
MAFGDTAKPAPAAAGKPASNSEQLAERLTHHDTRDITEVQELRASRLNRRFGFAFETAIVIASLAWGIAR